MISIRKFCPYFFPLLLLILWLYFFWSSTFRKMFEWRYIRFVPLTHFSHANNFRIGTQRSNTWYLRLSEEKKYISSKSEQQQEKMPNTTAISYVVHVNFVKPIFLFFSIRFHSYPPLVWMFIESGQKITVKLSNSSIVDW